MKDDSADNGEDADGSEGQDLGDFRAQLQKIGEERAESTEDTKRVEPYGSVYRTYFIPVAHADSHQNGGQSDGSDHHNGEGAIEGSSRCKDYDESKGSAEQAGGNHGPATRLG